MGRTPPGEAEGRGITDEAIAPVTGAAKGEDGRGGGHGAEGGGGRAWTAARTDSLEAGLTRDGALGDAATPRAKAPEVHADAEVGGGGAAAAVVPSGGTGRVPSVEPTLEVPDACLASPAVEARDALDAPVDVSRFFSSTPASLAPVGVGSRLEARAVV